MSKKLRFLIFAFLALVLLLVVGGVAYFLVQSREHVDALRNAMAALYEYWDAAENYQNNQ